MIEIRLATRADIPALPDIERSAAEAFRGGVHDWVADDGVTEAEAYEALIATGDVRVAVVDGVLAGFINTERHGDELHILELAVRQDMQKRGLGRALMAAARDLALARGCRTMALTTFRNLPFNAPFYESLGFEILSDPPAHLTRILAAEAAHGLTDRCAMRAEV